MRIARWSTFAVVLVGMLVAPLPAAAGNTVRGKVLRGTQPVAGVLVRLSSESFKDSASAVTSAAGEFVFHDVAAGPYTLSVSTFPGQQERFPVKVDTRAEVKFAPVTLKDSGATPPPIAPNPAEPALGSWGSAAAKLPPVVVLGVASRQ